MGRTAIDLESKFTRKQSSIERIARSAPLRETTPLPIRGPWGGYVPDIDESLLTPQDAHTVDSMFGFAGSLETAPGWEQIDTARLPLGTDNPPATAGTDHEPIVALIGYTEVGQITQRRLAITGDGPGGTVGHLYSWNGTVWAVVGTGSGSEDYSDAAGRILRMDSNEDDLYDWAYIPWLNINEDSTGGPGTGQLIFTNDGGHNGAMYVYPSGDDEYFDLTVSGAASFEARSVESYAGRIIVLNVLDAGTRIKNRLMASAINDGTTNLFTAIGSVTIDFDMFEGEGQRIEKLGNGLAVYFDDGVAAISQTGRSSSPFSVQVVSTNRGLIGTHAMVNMGFGLHFGIFTDGWFFLDATGTWREAGLDSRGGKILQKFTRTFYNLLNYEHRKRVVLLWDRENRIIRIAFPTSASTGVPDMVWYYHPESDTVWPDSNYSKGVNVWGEFFDAISDVTWTTIANVGWDIIDRPWDVELGNQRFRPVHGTTAGLVFEHSRSLFTRDGVEYTYGWKSHSMDMGSINGYKKIDKAYLEYTKTSSIPDPITLDLLMDSNTVESEVVWPTKGNIGENSVDFINNSTSGKKMSLQISGQGKTKVTGFSLDVTKEGSTTTDRGSAP